MELNLDGKTCLITGASAGIGAAIARVAGEGVNLAILARRRATRDPCKIQETSGAVLNYCSGGPNGSRSPEQVKRADCFFGHA